MYITVLLFTLLTTPMTHASEGPSKELLLPCDAKAEDIRQVDLKVTAQTTQGCRNQIKKSLETCMNGPAATAEDAAQVLALRGGGAEAAGKQQLQAYEAGKQRYLGQALVCSDEIENVNRACDENSANLKKAVRANNLAMSEAQKRAAPGDALGRPSSLDEVHAFQQTNLDLQKQIGDTNNAAGAARLALTHASQCETNQARLYAEASDKTGITIASAAAEGPAPTANTEETPSGSNGDEYKNIVADKAKEVGVGKAGDLAGESLSAGAKSIKLAGKAVGGVFPVLSAVDGDSMGVATGVVQTGADLFASPQTALRFSGVGTFLYVALYSTPASQCGEIYTDPVKAYRAGCSVNTHAGASANESAIGTLSSP